MKPRLARPEEAPELARIIDGAYQAYRERGVTLPDVSAGAAEAIAAGQVWTISDADDLLGVLMLSTDGADAHLMNVAVAANAQGRGIGGILIRHAVALAQTAGCAGIALATHRDLSENVSLYQHLGWQETERDGMRVRMYRAL